MKRLMAISILFPLVLSGCAEMIAAQKRADEEQCLGEGFRPRTDSFRLCRLTIEQAREKRAAEQRQKDFDKWSEDSRKDFEKWNEDNLKRREEEEARRKHEEDMKRWRCPSTLSSAASSASCL